MENQKNTMENHFDTVKKTSVEYDFSEAKRWFDIISDSVGKQKAEVIKQCMQENGIAWSLLLIYLNPYITFNLGVKSMQQEVALTKIPFSSAITMIDHISAGKGISRDSIARTKTTLLLIEKEDVRTFAKNYLTKSLKIGVTAETVNKAAGKKVIPTFGCMLANKYFEHTKEIVGKTISVTEKLDGIRALAIVKPQETIVEDGVGAKIFSIKDYSVEIFSRQGQQIKGLIEVESAIKALARSLIQFSMFTNSFVLDGELLITDRKSVPSKEQYKQTIGIVRSDKNSNKTGITYNVFDIVPYKAFTEGVCSIPYGARRQTLNLISKVETGPSVQVVPIKNTFYFADHERAFRAIMRMVEEARDSGEEGIMLNDHNAPYLCKRTNGLLKVKVFQDCDLKITGFQEGTGKYQGTLGALLVDYKGNTVGVGSGLTDQQRKFFWSNQQNMLGRIVTVQYFEETNDASGNKSIRFPIFKELREEDKEVSYD